MTYAAIVMSQVGAGLAWRTNRRSIAEVGLLSNRFLLVGIGVEVALIALLTETPGLQSAFHMRTALRLGLALPFALAADRPRRRGNPQEVHSASVLASRIEGVSRTGIRRDADRGSVRPRMAVASPGATIGHRRETLMNSEAPAGSHESW